MERKVFSKDLLMRALRERCIFLIISFLGILLSIVIGTNLFFAAGCALIFVGTIFAISSAYKQSVGDEARSARSLASAYAFCVLGVISFVIAIAMSVRSLFTI